MDRNASPSPDSYRYQMHHPGVTFGLSYSIPPPPPPPPNNEHALRVENSILKSLNDSLKADVSKLKSENRSLKTEIRTLNEKLKIWYGHAEDLRKLVVGFNTSLTGILDLNWNYKEKTTKRER